MQAETQHQSGQQSKILDFDWDAQNKLYHINKLAKIVTKFHYRNFLNHFRSHFYQSLKIQTQQPPQPQAKQNNDWPYMVLIRKVNKTEHQLLEMEFINMCAEKIQTVFRGYIQRKRFRLASEKLRKFVVKARAVLMGWKTRQIMKIVKLKQEMKIISIKRAEVSKQQQIVKVTSNTYSLRKLQYLKRTLDEEVKQFGSKFQYLFKTGSWVFEPKIARNVAVSVSKWKKKIVHHQIQSQIAIEPVKEDNYHISKIEEYKATEQEEPKYVPKAKRVREMRDRNKKPQSKQNEEQINKEESSNISTKNTSITTDFQSQERPIQAKGSYQFEDLPVEAVQQKASKVLAQKQPVNTKQKEESEEVEVKDKKNEEKQKDKVRMQKRQKYDPRKAILQQKLKKQQQLKIAAESPPQDKIPQIKPLQKGESQMAPILQKQKVVVSSKSQKVISKGQKQEMSNRSTVNIPKANKSKVQAKIDCWGNRKTNKKPAANQNNRMTYKSIHSKQQQQEFQFDNKSNLQSQPEVQPRSYIMKQGKQRQRQEEYQVQKGTQWKKDATQLLRRHQIQLKRQAMEQLRRQQMIKQQEYAHIHREVEQRIQIEKPSFQPEKQTTKNPNVSTPLRQKLRLAEQQRQRELHKSIQQLEQVYSDQYQNRYQRLIPKLGLLAAARQKESKGPIPVLLENSNFMKRKTVQNFPSNIFWVVASKIERSFKDFNRS